MKPREVIAKASFSATETAAVEGGIAQGLFRL
jgi:hypothetical protein